MAVLAVGLGRTASSASADAPLRITDTLTVQARQVPNRLGTGQPLAIELIFHNTGDQDLAAGPGPLPTGLFSFADFRFDWGVPCDASTQGPREVVNGGDSSLAIVHAAQNCAFTAVLIGGTIPAKGKASWTISTGTGSIPAVIAFTLHAAGTNGAIQRSEIRVQ
jgi:hypothetical protein